MELAVVTEDGEKQYFTGVKDVERVYIGDGKVENSELELTYRGGDKQTVRGGVIEGCSEVVII